MIVRAGIEHAKVLSELGAETFVDAHKESAPANEIETYLSEKYSIAGIAKELADVSNIYHLLWHDNKIAGFSKMVLNSKHPSVILPNASKMDQIYLLNSFHGLKLGAKLLQYNIEFSKSQGQHGMWLVVWAGNKQAITFYEKFDFHVVREDKFQLTDRHTSPCLLMLLDYGNSNVRISTV